MGFLVLWFVTASIFGTVAKSHQSVDLLSLKKKFSYDWLSASKNCVNLSLQNTSFCLFRIGMSCEVVAQEPALKVFVCFAKFHTALTLA